ncbi:MAG: hypothetical protein DRO52_01940 [Candidatus Hecatellales archaeon]|nr:MAG: hypothetical protein DRO52_01940 [Candidatus Hecatellales archaeon]
MVGFRKVFTLLLFLLILLSVGGLLGLKAEAQVAGTLSLSSPTFSGFSLLQITVIDKDLSDTEAAVPPPTVTVNGTTVKMFQAVDGSWFGFIRVWCWADTVNTNGVYDPGEPIIIDKDNDGVYDEGELVSGTPPPPGTSLVGITPASPPPQDPVEPGTGETTWTGAFTDITTVEASLGQELTVTYFDVSPVGEVSEKVIFNWVQASIEADRGEYPPDAKAYITVRDQDLNQDPTAIESYAVDPLNGETLLFLDRVRGGATSNIQSGLTLVETGPSTGVFEVQATLSSTNFAFIDVAIFRYEDQHPAVTVKTSASIITHLGLVSFDSDSYSLGRTATISLEEPDGNLDSKTVDTIQVRVWSDSDPTGFDVNLTETEVNSGSFKGTVTFTFEASNPTQGRLQAKGGDTVYVRYFDSSNDVGIAQNVTDTAAIISHTGTISLDRDTYVPGVILYVTVSDPDENLDPDAAETIPYTNYGVSPPWVSIESRYAGALLDGPYGVTCLETGPDTGTFEGRVLLRFTPGEPGDVPKLQVKPGATIKARYHEKMDEWGKERETLVEAKFMTTSGTLSLDASNYPPGCTLHPEGGIVRITVSDPDRNLSSASVEEYPNLLTIDVKTPEGASRPGYPAAVDLLETGPDTGVFEGKHTLSSSVCRGDLVEVTYSDEYDVAGNPRSVKAYARIVTHDAVLTVDKPEVPLLTELTITLVEPDWNFDSQRIDFVEAGAFGTPSGVDVWTTTSGMAGGIQVKLMETEVNSATFTATIMPGQTIPASYGDTLTIRYNDEQGSAGFPAKVEVKVKIRAYTGEVKLDREVYACNDTMTITIYDPDRNVDPEAYDSIDASQVEVKSTSWLTPVNPAQPLAETEANSATFQGTFKLQLFTGQTSPPTPGTIYVYNGDGVTVTYLDPVGASGREEEVSASARVEFTTATITFDKEVYSLEDQALITIQDPDANKNSKLRDEIEVSIISEADPAGIALHLLETSEDSGVFEGFFFYTEAASQGSRLHVNPVDKVTVLYRDETPNPSDVPGYEETGVIKPIWVKRSAYLGLAPQPAMPLTITKPKLLSPEGVPLVSAMEGEQVILQSEVSNVGTREQPFLYIVQIRDFKGRVVFLNFVQGVIPAGKSLPVGVLWIPPKLGTYTVEAFTWESWKKPIPLSPTSEVTVQVAFKPS